MGQRNEEHLHQDGEEDDRHAPVPNHPVEPAQHHEHRLADRGPDSVVHRTVELHRSVGVRRAVRRKTGHRVEQLVVLRPEERTEGPGHRLARPDLDREPRRGHALGERGGQHALALDRRPHREHRREEILLVDAHPPHRTGEVLGLGLVLHRLVLVGVLHHARRVGDVADAAEHARLLLVRRVDCPRVGEHQLTGERAAREVAQGDPGRAARSPPRPTRPPW